MKQTPLVIIGVSAFSKTVFQMISSDVPSYRVVAFAHARSVNTLEESFCGVSVIQLEDIQKKFPPHSHEALISIGYVKMNEVREHYIEKVAGLGYTLASCISSRSLVDSSVSFGKNTIIFEGNIIQCFSKIEDGVIMSRGNSIGHDSTIGGNSFVANRTVLCGHNVVGKKCFLGSNATILDGVKIADRTLVGATSIIKRDTLEGSVYVAAGTLPLSGKDSRSFFCW